VVIDFNTAHGGRSRVATSIDVRRWLFDGPRVGGGVTLTTTACNYGGVRYWFVCPEAGCTRRVAKRYQIGGRYACRHCHRLAYRTQHENFFDRGLLKAQRIRMKLGGSANMTLPFPPKPKFMRWSTYYLLANADNGGLMRSIVGLRAWLAARRRS
jgi:hypothetical protein